MKRIAVLLAVFSGAGCLVDQSEETSNASLDLKLSLTLPEGFGAQVSSHRGFKELKEVDLTVSPFYVVARLEADDMAEAVLDTHQGPLPESGSSLDLVLEAPSGSMRRLSLVAFLWDGVELLTFRHYEEISFLAAGNQSMEAQLEQSDTWTLEGTIHGTSEEVDEVFLQEVITKVILPPRPVEWDGEQASFVYDDIPVGSFFYLRIRWASGELSEPLYFCPLFFGQEATITRDFDLLAESC